MTELDVAPLRLSLRIDHIDIIAALIREREHGTIEHLLVMPVTAFEIMVGKLWSMGLVVLAATAFCLFVVVRGLLAVPV